MVSGMKPILLVFILTVFVRYLVSIHSYSGAAKAPLYGDYEAQRHWMEITTNLPLDQWYFNSTDNDLLYWGLDYPPLTAYHSWLVGTVAHYVEPGSVALFSSRGYENPTSKIFFRMSVIVSDVLTYLPAVYFFVRKHHHRDVSWSHQVKAILFLTMQPALLLIDHGHFQYNGVSLGLALMAFSATLDSSYVLASVLFSLSLNFKQMGLYYSTTMFFYLLGVSINKQDIKGSVLRIARIGMAVLITFGVCWFPFLRSLDVTKQVLHRIFPVARGLFEDKVANFWCSVSPFIKFKNIFAHDKLMLISLGCTLLSVLPSGLSLLCRPNKQAFIFALISSSLGYYLFSFQVHEKSILLPLLPVSMLISTEHALFCCWFQQVALFSMYPLLSKDELRLPYVIAMMLVAVYTLDVLNTNNAKSRRIAYMISLSGMCAIHGLSLAVSPPRNLPDLFAMLFAIYSFMHFFVAFIYANYLSVTLSLAPSKSKTCNE